MVIGGDANQLAHDESSVDLCVIGGGINGLAIARDAALRGLKVVLVERGDLASGTSAWSTRLIHGGLKYLEHLDLKLVMESVRERKELLQAAPHLVHPYPMLIPFYADNSRSRHLIRAGLATHDVLSLGDGVRNSRSLSAEQVATYVPGLCQEGLKSAALYHDANVPWAERLCVELALDASAHGATILTRTSVEQLEIDGARVVGVDVRTQGTEKTTRVRATVTINAAGPWVDDVLGHAVTTKRLIGGTKGSHIVVDPFPGAPNTCVFFEAQSDQRPMFVLPWAGRYMIGSTDLHYDGDLDEVTASDDEIHYLTSETNQRFPAARLSSDDVLYSYAGIRPLPFSPGATDNATISRGHTIVDHSPAYRGVLSIVGGKLTTHRALAEDAVDAAVSQLGRSDLPCVTRGRPLPGAAGGDDWATIAGRLRQTATSLSPRQVERLLGIYGTRTEGLLDQVAVRPELATVIDDESGAIAAEIDLAIDVEGARSISDVLFRRTMVALNGDVGLAASAKVADYLRSSRGWSDAQIDQDLAEFARERDRLRPRVPTPPTYAAPATGTP